MSHAWLEKLKVAHIAKRHRTFGCANAFLIFTVAPVLALILYKQELPVLAWLGIPGLAVLIGILAFRYRSNSFFSKIHCPRCGYNPTRRKSDHAPRQDIDKVLAQLARYEDCPNCGDPPTEKPGN